MKKKNKDVAPENEANETEAETSAEQVEAEVIEEAEPVVVDELKLEKEKYLRLAAEYDNYRKRVSKEREMIFSDVRSDTVLKFLPVYDNLRRALTQECEDEAYAKGIEMTMNQLKSIMDGFGVTEIEAVGQKFDPEMHNAVMHIEDENYGEGEIVQEFEKGFKLGDKVIRFSMVQVAN